MADQPTAKPRLFALLDDLVNRWCDQRALGPLAIILRAYPMVAQLSDNWFDLRDALRTLRGGRLPPDEAAIIEEALREVEGALERSGWDLDPTRRR